MNRVVIAAVLLVASDIGCNASNDACVPGRQISCSCVGGSVGSQACNDDGSGFAACICPDGGGQLDSGTDSAAGSGGDASTGGTGGSSTSVQLSGSAAKGPFMIGSTVDVAPVDSVGNPTGTTYSTVTTDDFGDFAVHFSYQGAVQLEATGQWFSELSGTTETSPLTLHGLATVTAAGSQHAYINAVTHLVYLRIKTLMAAGATLAEATTQAESELRSELVVGGPNFNPNAPGTELNLLGGDTDQAAYVFAVSAVSLQAAVDSSLSAQNYLNDVQSSFSPGGTVTTAAKNAFSKAQGEVEPDDVMKKLADLFTLKSFPGTVPNINRALDTDRDGVPNLDDDCVLIANSGQSPVRGVCAYRKRTLPKVSPSAFGSPTSIAADLDGDGDMDIITVGLPDVHFYKNDGAGVFAVQTFDLATALGTSRTAPTININTAAIGDVVGGSNPDLVLSCEYPNGDDRLVALAGDGTGSFGAPTTLWTNSLAGCLGDTLPCSPTGTPCCSGTCFAANCAPNAHPLVAFSVLVLADVNGDGKLDIVGVPGSTIGVVTNPGSGAWPAATITVPNVLQINALLVGNFTADSNPDILIATGEPDGGGTGGPSGLYLLSGDGSGGFGVGPSSAVVDNCTTAMVAGDFDGDAVADLALLDQNSTKLSLVFGAGDGTFGARVDVPVIAPPGLNYQVGGTKCPMGAGLGTSTLSVGHYIDSSHWDVAVGTSVFVTNGRGPATQEYVHYVAGVGTSRGKSGVGWYVTAPDADFNGDGTTDIVSTDQMFVSLMNPTGYRSW